MPPIRTPLRNITLPRAHNYELTPYQRGQVVGMTYKGAKSTEIESVLDITRGAVRNTLSLELFRHDGETLPRIGRPKEYSESDVRHVLRHVRKYPKDTYVQVITACQLTFKTTTLKTILKDAGITNWRARRRPTLTEANAAARLAWCLKWRHITEEEWGLICWSDECSVERGRGKRAEWVFRTANQVWNREMIQTYDCKKNMKVMVWGCFWDRGRSNLYIMDRDFESKKHGYSAESYLEVLEAEVAPMFEKLEQGGGGYLFMQDNASIHTARKVREWFALHGIDILKGWPPYSPDLNPIEHIWWLLKVRVFEMFPAIAADKSDSEDSRQRLESALQAAWDTLDKESFDVLYKSMPARIEACIAADGWHTKY
ncbi:hypothetical protein HYFRA_00005309 [Hymenoscyphus fraxineus]|uniref:Transposase n=1 Tax=Hymenoscyphus fraxineus TaxID=746836 RepID=A0A9N9Q0A1_9HELO|nr:hypothetical protein HYFRA_00005309 [Hymenoscyphus fraxineus]